MPLSEEEQRVLQDIERSFYETDPKFARTVSTTTLYRHAGRNCKWAAAGFVACLLLLLFAFTKLLFLGFVGFVGMVVCAAIFVRNVRRIGEASLREVQDSQNVDDMRERLRKFFRG